MTSFTSCIFIYLWKKGSNDKENLKNLIQDELVFIIKDLPSIVRYVLWI